MSEEITPEIFEHLVHLAALELNEDEAQYLRRQLNNQLKAIHELEAIPLSDDIKITSHGVPYSPLITPPIRDDAWLPNPAPEDILTQAPETDDNYFIVPDIPHTDLD
ncbi:MAG: aspartyl/glutamyl-tRNA amidotransferase subunit C [Anaerolineales bacterium]|nr:aspartyl/glutamyl-tRNA amidotransferase subunit C [Anaerolineales bacterium]